MKALFFYCRWVIGMVVCAKKETAGPGYTPAPINTDTIELFSTRPGAIL